MKALLQGVLVLIVLVAFLWAIVAWNAFKLRECRQVGHSALYCATQVLKDFVHLGGTWF